jgi:hypothetical protein
MSACFVALLILLAGNHQAARTTRNAKGQKVRFQHSFNTYRGARCELCITMHNDAHLITTKFPQVLSDSYSETRWAFRSGPMPATGGVSNAAVRKTIKAGQITSTLRSAGCLICGPSHHDAVQFYARMLCQIG